MMLVLSRRQDETVVLPELGITIKIIRTKGNSVRLGIEAPASIRVLRGELAFEQNATLLTTESSRLSMQTATAS